MAYSDATFYNQSFASIYRDNSTETSDFILDIPSVLTALILVIVIIGTAVGNILVCIAVCLVRKLRRPCNYLLVSLAVSDLCVAILVMPIALLYEILGDWPFGPVVCNLWVSFDVLSCAASILNLCMISVDRYYAITKPLEYGVKRTPKRMILCVFLVWFGAACISLPPLLILGNEHVIMTKDGPVPACNVCQNFGYQIYATLGSFYIPLSVMMLVYYKIFRAARRIVMDEKKAQSHLEAHYYLEISVKNGDGMLESKIGSEPSSPTANVTVHHRSSSLSTHTSCSIDKPIISRCFKTRNCSSESQCPMLSKLHIGKRKKKKKLKTLTASNEKESKQSSPTSNLLEAPKAHAPTGILIASSQTTQKKLRFQLAKERKASTTLGIIMSAFTVCWLPFFVLALVRPFLKDESDIPHSLSSLFLWLGYANSLLNPIIYATLNRDFRKPFQEILYFRCGNLNHMMREEFYHSQYGDPDQAVYCGTVTVPASNVRSDYVHHRLAQGPIQCDDSIEYIEAEAGDCNQTKKLAIMTESANESFL